MIELTKDKQNLYIDKFQKLFSNGEYSPDNLLAYLDELIPGVFICDTGVWENYNLMKHTLMVLNQFEKYF